MLKNLLVVTALAASMPAYAAIDVTYDSGPSAIDPSSVIIEDFEDETAGDALPGVNAAVFADSVGGIAARPAFNSTGNFGAVLGEPADGNYTINFAASSLFSFALGSLDTYNTLTLLFSDSSELDFIGAGINEGLIANGNQASADTNGRVTYTVNGGPLIIGARFASTSNSFEFDDLAIRAVPEPATWMMMILGFGAVGFGMRRRRSAGTAAFA